jgi:hypothetical protein
MRIIIESQNGGEPGNATHPPDSVLVALQDVNAGSPASPFLQAMTTNGYSNASAHMTGLDAGSPAQWLLDAIASATSPAGNHQNVFSDQDAGAAPAL